MALASIFCQSVRFSFGSWWQNLFRNDLRQRGSRAAGPWASELDRIGTGTG